MVAIVNAGIKDVVIANPDENGGALASERLSRLPKVWTQLATQAGRHITFADCCQAEDTTRIPMDLKSLLYEVFWTTQESPNATVTEGILF
jgi:hypothetical protein